MAQIVYTVAPDTVTEFARKLLLENNWRKAISVMKQAFIPEMALDDIVSVLKGRSNCERTPEGALTLCEQNKQDPEYLAFIQTLTWQKAGIFEKEGIFYQPYAIVQQFSKEDESLVLADIEKGALFYSAEQYRDARAQHYMRDSQNELVYFNSSAQAILMKRVIDPPFWYPVFDSPLLAYNEFMKHRCDSLELLGTTTEQLRNEDNPKSWEFYFEALLLGGIQTSVDVPLANTEKVKFEEMFLCQESMQESIFDCQCTNDKDSNTTVSDIVEDFKKDAFLFKYECRIHSQAERIGGYIELHLKQEVTLKNGKETATLQVPAGPFLAWAKNLHKDAVLGKVPEWPPVCPRGLKMSGDGRVHSDWWLGAGLHPNEAYAIDHPANKAAWRFVHHRFSDKLADEPGYDFLKLSGTGTITGLVVKPGPNEGVPAGSIAIVPNAGPTYEIALLSACKNDSGAVIAEIGGKLAHLTTVSREMNARLAVVDSALSRFEVGELITVNFATNKVYRTSSKN